MALHPPHECGLPRLFQKSISTEQVIAQCGRNGESDKQRSGDRSDVRECKRSKHSPFEPAEIEERQKHQNNNERGEHDRIANLARGSEDDVFSSSWKSGVRVLAQSTEDVFDINNGVID